MTTPSSTPSVIVVGDDPSQRKRAQALREQLRTVVVRDTAEALETALLETPDLIVACLDAAQTDGIALATAVRSEPALAESVVLLVTSVPSDPAVVVRALEAGADDCIEDSGDAALLMAKAFAWLRRRRLEVELSTSNQELEARAASREAEFRAIFDNSLDAVLITDDDGRYLDVNPAACALLGLSREEIVGKAPDDFTPPKMDFRGRSAWFRQEVETGVVKLRRPDGVEIEAEFAARANFVPGRHVAMLRDVTERKSLEEQLRLSQRMEAIGRLAGGIAHDFNNLLTVILVSSEMLTEHLPEGGVAWRHARETQDAANRAASLTNQLLAFSRQQMLRPVDVDLNDTVEELSAMLQRVIGEDVALKTRLEPDLPPVRVDPGQIGQVIMNLAVNARDAMPNGGSMIIETKRVVLTDAYAARHVSVRPGPYVMLAVSDTGTGMDAETRRRVFEPFFTTKELGKGTGLGLSTVYGIVKQSGGNIWVYSEPGHGSVFKIYFPEVEPVSAPPEKQRVETSLPHGQASVLLVEDEPGVRAVATRVLERCGYTVAAASSGEEALAWCAAQGFELDLLITDVVMPGISGSQLVTRLRAQRDGLRVLYTSGYTEDAVVHHGVAAGEHFLSKPFTPTALAHKVREVLDAPIEAKR